MAKVQIKSEKITLFRGIFHVKEYFPVLRVLLSTSKGKFVFCITKPFKASRMKMF